ncbi:MAG: hypothetical protein ABSD11_00285 [Methylocella sp.]|jgi:hypothetical protein
MRKAFVICAGAFIAIGAAVSFSTKVNAEDNGTPGVPRYIRPYPVQPSAAPQEGAYYHRHSYHRLYYRRHHYHRRYY